MLSWSPDSEPFTRSVSKDELHITMEFSSLLRSFIFLKMLLCEIKKTKVFIKENQICRWIFSFIRFKTLIY